MDVREYSSEEAAMEIEKPHKKKNCKKRRFSDEQVKSLESIFESDSKLEQRKKEELAQELGMQPRQVAIWFQNKRARWKSKQIEQDYKALRANYDALSIQFECLKEEKRSLLDQLQKLNDLVENPRIPDGDANCESEAKSSSLPQDLDRKLSDDHDKSRSGQGGGELLKVGQNVEASEALNGKWCSFDTGGGQYDQSFFISQLWDVWSGW